ncbi:MAG TPA: response regulator [Myxococcaceae bacterium]|nr:response regulator [Myxococcaceae bacterium]
MRRTRVLVVDDEPLVASAARRLLSREHEVQVAHSGPAALALLDDGRFDAVLCDIMMPQMTGLELHARLSSTQPEVAARMVFLTGGVFDACAERFLQEHSRWCMGKPFEPGALLALVAERIATADALAPCRRMV